MLRDYRVCYHGTIKRDGEYIKENGIEIDRSRVATDFGKGFYVTNNLKQAERWAEKKSVENKVRFGSFGGWKGIPFIEKG